MQHLYHFRIAIRKADQITDEIHAKEVSREGGTIIMTETAPPAIEKPAHPWLHVSTRMNRRCCLLRRLRVT